MNDFFSNEIDWIGDRIREDTQRLPDSVKPLAEQYTSKRLIFSSDNDGFIRLDPKAGLPTRNFIPQVVFWIADAFDLKNIEISQRLALGLVYSSLAFAVLDDMIEDTQSPPSYLALANMYLYRYLESFDGLFEPESGFWHYLVTSVKNFTIMVYRDFTFTHEIKDILSLDPLSEAFLFESCKSYSALVMTTLAAIAYATDNESKIPQLKKFWTDYATGHRLYDDLNDLYKDLGMRGYNNSSVLLYALKKAGTNSDLTEELVYSMLLDPAFIDKIYGTMLGLFKRAQEDAAIINSPYLDAFMDELISTHIENRDSLLNMRSNFFKDLKKILTPRP